MYHWFVPEGHDSGSRSPQLEVTPQRFEEHLAWLARRGYQTITLSRLYDHVEQGTPIPQRPVVITFDDGTRDFARHGWPALRRHGFVATQFIVAGEVGGVSRWDRDRGEPDRELMDWDEIRQLADEGLEIGSHTMTHPDLAATADDVVLREMLESRVLLENKLDRPIEFLAYPYGSFTYATERYAEAAGYRGACAVLLRKSDVFRSDRFRLRRLTAKRDDRGLRFSLRFAAGRVKHRIATPSTLVAVAHDSSRPTRPVVSADEVREVVRENARSREAATGPTGDGTLVQADEPRQEGV